MHLLSKITGILHESPGFVGVCLHVLCILVPCGIRIDFAPDITVSGHRHLSDQFEYENSTHLVRLGKRG